MGDEFTLRSAEPLRVKAVGTGKIARVEIIKDGKVIHAAAPAARNAELEFKDRAELKGRHYYYVRLLQDDGMIAWSSPLFAEMP